MRFGDKWWAAYGPACGGRNWVRVAGEQLLPGWQNYRDDWSGQLQRDRAATAAMARTPPAVWEMRFETLREVSAQLLPELRSGGILIEADGDHIVQFQAIVVPVGFWRAANWVLYRASPHDYTSPRLLVLDPLDHPAPPTYYNPKLTVPQVPARPAEQAAAGGTLEKRPAVATALGARAIKAQIREVARIVHRDHNAPDMVKAEKLIRAQLREGGRKAGKQDLRDVVKEDEFARRGPGKPKAT